jgi:hypothetical protein
VKNTGSEKGVNGNILRKISLILSTLILITILAGCGPTDKNDKDNKKVSGSSLRFAVMADCRGDDGGINSAAIKKTMEEMKKVSPQPSFTVVPGDLVSGSGSYTEEKAQLLYFKSTITKF